MRKIGENPNYKFKTIRFNMNVDEEVDLLNYIQSMNGKASKMIKQWFKDYRQEHEEK